MRIAATESFDSIEVNDFDAAAELMRMSWIENNETPLEYSPEFIQRFLNTGGNLPSISAALSNSGKLVAFVCASPRNVVLCGASRKMALLTFFTVSPEWKRHRLGLRVWSECVAKVRSAGFDGTVHYCVKGARSNSVTVAATEQAGYLAQKVKEVPHLARFLAVGPEESRTNVEKVAGELLIELSAGLDAQLKRHYSIEEARQFLDRDDVISQVHREGSAAGMLAGYLLPVLDKDRTQCLLLNEILWGNLSEVGKSELLDRFLKNARTKAQFVVVPQLGYTDLSPLRAARFRLSTQILNAYVTLFDHSTVPELSTMYLDVL